MLPATCDARLDRSSWSIPRLFAVIASLGDVVPDEMDRVFNLGLGMVMLVSSDAVGSVLDTVLGRGLEATVVGEVAAGSGKVVVA